MHAKVRFLASGAVIAAITLALALALGAPAAAAGHGNDSKPKAPVIRESFTPLPCTGKPDHRTTLQQEGCAEHQILRSDSRINAIARSIFARLSDRASEERFIAAQRAWLNYRHADCSSVSDVFEGGSQAPVLYAQCEVARNGERIKDLNAFLADLRETG